MSEKTTYEAIDGRIAPESLTADTSAGLEVVDGHAVKAPGDYENPDLLYEMLIARIRRYHPSTDVSMIEKHTSLRKSPWRAVPQVRGAVYRASSVGSHHTGGPGDG